MPDPAYNSNQGLDIYRVRNVDHVYVYASYFHAIDYKSETMFLFTLVYLCQSVGF